MFGRFLILVLSVLPKHAMSRAAGAIANIPIPRPLRRAAYHGYSRLFGARPEEAALPLEAYGSINAFFTRELRPGLRTVARDAVVCPVDGTVGAWGVIAGDMLVQAKGRNYSLAALLGDKAMADRMEGGTFATLYLAPKDYHRIHVPIDGIITAATYIPGDLWPVNTAAVAHVADLFAVNERIVVTITVPSGGTMAVVLVGATMVGMTRVAFDDLHTNARRREVQQRRYDPGIEVRAGDPLGHFEFGSTVVLACTPDSGVIAEMQVGRGVQMGEPIGELTPDPARSR